MSLDHQVQSEGGRALVSSERPTAASLIPVDDGEVLLQSKELLEATDLVDHGQARALLDQQEHRVGGIRAADADPLGRVAELYWVERVDLHFLLPTWMLREIRQVVSAASQSAGEAHGRLTGGLGQPVRRSGVVRRQDHQVRHVLAHLVDRGGCLTQSPPVPDPRDVTVLEHVHVIGQVTDHEERRMPGLTDK